MATVKAIKYGMKGDDVSNLQTSLKNAGYNVDVDGSFGPQTLAAVKQYQKANGLTVDGMVGPQTQTSLWGGNKNTASVTNLSLPKTDPGASASAIVPAQNVIPPQDPGTPNKSAPGASPAPGASAPVEVPENGVKTENNTNVNNPDKPTYETYTPPAYVKSETVQQAEAALNAALAAKPGAYQSKWQAQIDDIIDRILNREEFSYDVNEDALYQQYKDQYIQGGKMAMQDTTGQMASMTGGYGNSFAATAGNQAYQAYLAQLNEVVPELYGMARDDYYREGEEMYNRYGLLSDQEAQDYGRYMDAYNQWVAERDYAAGRYDSEQDRAWAEYLEKVQQEQWRESMDYQKEMDANDIAYRDKVFDLDEKQREIDNANKETSRQDDLKREETNDKRDEVWAILEAGGIPSDELLAAAGISKETVTALSNAYQKASSNNSGSDSGYITDVQKIEEWSAAVLEAETEEEAMRYLERLEQLDPGLADSLYNDWLKAHALGHKITGTTVATPSGGPKGSGGSGSGLAGVNKVVK